MQVDSSDGRYKWEDRIATAREKLQEAVKYLQYAAKVKYARLDVTDAAQRA